MDEISAAPGRPAGRLRRLNMTVFGTWRTEIRRFSVAGAVVAAAVLVYGINGIAGANAASDKKIIVLTQTPCQFLESENGVDRGFKSAKKADCDEINLRTGPARLAQSKILELKPGKYIFRVTNKNVPYTLGFWLRSKGYDWRNPVHRFTKTSVSGGGLVIGKTQDYAVTLKPGEYLYSCPLNPTPDYRLVVKE
jgi:hypothetical protein